MTAQFNEHNEHLERMISRKLDGELSAEESLALDKLLIRSPEARCLLEQITALDQAAAAEIVRACSGPVMASVPAPAVRPRAGRRIRNWNRFGPPMTAAACVLVWIGWSIWSQAPVSRQGPAIQVSRPLAGPGGFQPIAPVAWPAPAYQVGRHVQYYGVYDNDQSKLYLLEVQRTDQLMDDPQRLPAALGQPIAGNPM